MLLTVLLVKEIAPAVVMALPQRVEPSNRLRAPTLMTVPWNREFIPKLTTPVTCQNTFFKSAPFIKVTVEFSAVDKAPPTLIINEASGIFLPSKIKFPVSDVAPPVQ